MSSGFPSTSAIGNPSISTIGNPSTSATGNPSISTIGNPSTSAIGNPSKLLTAISILIAFSAFSLLTSCSTTDEGPWTDLFNGEDFSEFQQLGGEAIFRVDNGIIIGTTVAGTPNSFMATRKIYDDFILEYKVFVDTSINSGVQIRSRAYLNGRVHGYQVEIDPSPRAYSGGVYDEARRDWLNDLSENEAGRNAFENLEWNHYRVEAFGNSIKTWINGVMCANMVDDADASGFIAFQVHNINATRKPWTEGVEVHWKDIRIMTENLEKYRIQDEDPVPVKVIRLRNQLSEQEIKDGWELLFDGISMDKWRGAHKESFPDSGWYIENGILEIRALGGKESLRAGDIVTIEEYADFEFCIDFKLDQGSNSGIKYYVTEEEKVRGSAIGLEYQLIDDERNKDALSGGRDGNHTLASLYDLITADKKYVNGPGEWNMARIVSSNGKVEHYLNNQLVVEYERGSAEFCELVARSKYKKWKNFGEAESAHLLLQEHGHNASFRNIKIRRLN